VFRIHERTGSTLGLESAVRSLRASLVELGTNAFADPDSVPLLPLRTEPLRRPATTSCVLAAPPGRARDEMIVTWSASGWHAYSASRAAVLELIRTELARDHHLNHHM
jgi:hypothetical protein